LPPLLDERGAARQHGALDVGSGAVGLDDRPFAERTDQEDRPLDAKRLEPLDELEIGKKCRDGADRRPRPPSQLRALP